jgi:hypothetical protein
MEGVQSRWSDLLYACAAGEPFSIKVKKGFGWGS